MGEPSSAPWVGTWRSGCLATTPGTAKAVVLALWPAAGLNSKGAHAPREPLVKLDEIEAELNAVRQAEVATIARRSAAENALLGYVGGYLARFDFEEYRAPADPARVVGFSIKGLSFTLDEARDLANFILDRLP